MSTPKSKCLHIAPHYGGGVGSTVLDIIKSLQANYSITNTIVSLDKAHSREVIDELDSSITYFDNFFLFFEDLSCLVRSSDVIIIHYWNHPLLSLFFSTFSFPSSRLLVWSHTSGLYEPNIIPNYIYQVAAKLLYSSDISLILSSSHNKKNLQKISVVRSARDLSSFLNAYVKRDYDKSRRRIVYIGTVSRQKMHQECISIFQELAGRSIELNIVGDPVDKGLVDSLARTQRVTFSGYQQDIVPFFLNADCFVYPLNSCHYGTGELVLIEAMASGLPCVCMNNPAERSIIDHGITGYLADTPQELIDYVVKIIDSPIISRDMSHKAYETAKNRFSLEKSVDTIANHINDALALSAPSFEGVALALPGIDIVFESMIVHSLYDSRFIDNLTSSNLNQCVSNVTDRFTKIFQQTPSSAHCLPHKGTPEQYHKYFPNSSAVSEICSNLRLLSMQK